MILKRMFNEYVNIWTVLIVVWLLFLEIFRHTINFCENVRIADQLWEQCSNNANVSIARWTEKVLS